VQDLQTDFAAFTVNRFGDVAMFAHLPRKAQLAPERCQSSSDIRGYAACDDKTDTASDTFPVKGRQLFKTVALLLKTGVH
jgi:hypothetical protein